MRHLFSRNTSLLLRAGTVLGLAFSAALAVPRILAAAASPATAVDVNIATVAPGTKVTWINHDETPHTVTSNDKSFGSKGLDTDDKFEHTFATEGDFNYIC